VVAKGKAVVLHHLRGYRSIINGKGTTEERNYNEGNVTKGIEQGGQREKDSGRERKRSYFLYLGRLSREGGKRLTDQRASGV